MVQQVEEAGLTLSLHYHYLYYFNHMQLLLPCYHFVQSSASTPTHTITIIPSSLPLIMSDWWLRQQPSAVRYSRLSSPPGWEGKGGRISELCWFGTVSRSLLHHPPHDAATLPERDSWMSWQLQGVWGKDNVQWAICLASFSPSLSITHQCSKKIVSVTVYTWLIVQCGRCCTLCICVSRFVVQTYSHTSTCTYAVLKKFFHGWN